MVLLLFVMGEGLVVGLLCRGLRLRIYRLLAVGI